MDSSILDSFTVISDTILMSLDQGTLRSNELIGVLQGIQKIFQTVPNSDVSLSQQGLWGELFFIASMGGDAKWLEFWHSNTFRRWDFSSANKHIEVKTSKGDSRVYRFAHRQLLSTQSEEVMVLSMLLEVDPEGISLRTLICQARESIGSHFDALVKLESAVRHSLMMDSLNNGPTFNGIKASTSFRWYWAREIPKFPLPEPIGVSDTHYRVDLTVVEPVDEALVGEWLRSW